MFTSRYKQVSPFSKLQLMLFAMVFAVSGGYIVYSTTHAAGSACSTNVTTSTFAAAVSSATAGQTICLATGNYGTWAGVNKAITLAPQAAATPTMTLNIGLGDGNFTIDGLTIAGASIYGNSSNYGSSDRPQNITIKNSTFTAAADISYIANANILLDHDTFNNIDVNSSCTSVPARVWISGNGSTPSGVTLSNSTLSGGNSDGVQAGIPANIIGNVFDNIQEKSSSDCAHTDAIQLYGGSNMVIRGNLIHSSADGIVAYDGTDHNLIEDNVLDLVNGRYGIELYSDTGSIVRHNTLVYGTGCAFDPCGGVYLDHKSGDPAGTGTVIENNIASNVNPSNGSTAATNRNNMLHSGASGSNFNGIPAYTAGAAPTTYAGFVLTAGSPGHHAGSDGLDVGIRASASPTATPTATATATATPAPTAPPTATPAPTATPPAGNAADLNADGKVNVFDLSILLSHWGATGAGDLDHNGRVDVFDLSRLLSAWAA